MKKTLFLIIALLLSVVFYSCKKPVTYCGAEDPMNEIDWLKQEANSYTTPLKIYELDYNGQQGFYFVLCLDSACNNSTQKLMWYKSCTNNLICSWGGIVPPNCSDFDEKTTFLKLIYSK